MRRCLSPAFWCCRWCRRIPGNLRLPSIRRSTSFWYWEPPLACPTFFCPPPVRSCKRGMHGKMRHAAPYRFYAVSNTGSMLALVSYPLLIEPWFATSHQAVGWSWAYAAVALSCAVVARSSSWNDLSLREGLQGMLGLTRKVQTLWICLAACGSALLLAITHHIFKTSLPFRFFG